MSKNIGKLIIFNKIFDNIIVFISEIILSFILTNWITFVSRKQLIQRSNLLKFRSIEQNFWRMNWIWSSQSCFEQFLQILSTFVEIVKNAVWNINKSFFDHLYRGWPFGTYFLLFSDFKGIIIKKASAYAPLEFLINFIVGYERPSYKRHFFSQYSGFCDSALFGANSAKQSVFFSVGKQGYKQKSGNRKVELEKLSF